MVEIVLDASALDRLGSAVSAAAMDAMEAVKTDLESSQTVPFDEGTMQGSISTRDQWRDGESLHTILSTGDSDSPQARRLYFNPEYNFQRANNPNAGAAWYAPYLPGGSKSSFLLDAFAARLKERSK